MKFLNGTENEYLYSNLSEYIELNITYILKHTEYTQRMRITEWLMQSIRCSNYLGYDSYSCSTINPLAQVSQWQPKVCSFCKDSGHTQTELCNRRSLIRDIL